MRLQGVPLTLREKINRLQNSGAGFVLLPSVTTNNGPGQHERSGLLSL